MKIYIRAKGDRLTNPPIATIEGNPLTCAKCIASIIGTYDDKSILNIIYYNCKELETNEIAFFTTDMYFISQVKDFTVPANFKTYNEVPA